MTELFECEPLTEAREFDTLNPPPLKKTIKIKKIFFFASKLKHENGQNFIHMNDRVSLLSGVNVLEIWEFGEGKLRGWASPFSWI